MTEPAECTHEWASCPLHNPEGKTDIGVVAATTCIYGGAELKDGGTWDESTSKDVWERVFKRLEA